MPAEERGPDLRQARNVARSWGLAQRLATPLDRVRRLQTSLRAKAKAEPTFRFYTLRDKVCREDVLSEAYGACRRNGGAAGVDGETFAAIETAGRKRWLGRLREELEAGEYRPRPLLRVWIPKSNGGQRPLGIPCVRDRVVETAGLMVLGPIFEADLLPQQFGFRPGRDAKTAVRRAFWHITDHGRSEVVDADLSDYFSSIPHGPLMRCVGRRVACQTTSGTRPRATPRTRPPPSRRRPGRNRCGAGLEQPRAALLAQPVAGAMVNLGGGGSGGGLLLGRLNGLTVAEADARDHLREPLGAVQPAPVALGALGELEDHRQRGLARQAALRPLRPQPHRGEGALDRVRRPDVLPVLGRHRVEGEQRLPVLGQAGHSLVVLGTVLGDEAVERGLRLLPVLGLVDGVQVLLGLALQGPRQLVEHVRGFVHPTPLLPGLWPDLVQRLPEAERAVAGRQLGIDDQPVLVAQTEQELAPALGALAEAVLDRQQLLATLGVGPDQDQQALPLVGEPRGEVDPVGPEVDVAAGRQVAPLPARVLPLPGLGQAPDRRRRQPRRVGPEERHQGLRELPGRDALQVEPGQQLLDVPGPSQVGRQDGRAEADRPRAVPAAVADPRSADRERADPGLDVPLRGVPVAHHTSATLAIGEVGVGGDECLHLGLDHLHQHPPRSLAQHRQQRVVRDRRAWLRQRDDGTFLHGVSFLVT